MRCCASTGAGVVDSCFTAGEGIVDSCFGAGWGAADCYAGAGGGMAGCCACKGATFALDGIAGDDADGDACYVVNWGSNWMAKGANRDAQEGH